MRILVTGGAGFIGSHVVDAYINEGHSVVVIDDLSSGKKTNLNPKARFYQADIRDRAIENILSQERIEVINHHAAQIRVRLSVENSILDAEINILGLLNLATIGKKIAVQKIIFSSSGGAIYGEAKKIPTPEDYQPLHPLSPYGISKLCGEHYLRFYQETHHIPCVILRYANVYGPRQDPHGEAGVVAIFSQKLLLGKQCIINGDGKQVRDFVYVGDVASANILALKNNCQGIYNIASGEGTDINSLFELLNSLVGGKYQAEHGPAKLGEQRKSILDISLAKKELGWRYEVHLLDGLKTTLEYFRSTV